MMPNGFNIIALGNLRLGLFQRLLSLLYEPVNFGQFSVEKRIFKCQHPHRSPTDALRRR